MSEPTVRVPEPTPPVYGQAVAGRRRATRRSPFGAFGAALLLLPLAATSVGTGVPQGIEELWREGRYQEAETVARELVDALTARSAPEPLAMADALDLLVEASSRSGRAATPEVLVHARRAVAIKETFLDSADARLAPSLLGLAVVYRARAELSAAVAPLERALDILEREEPAGDRHLEALEELARLEGARGRLGEARVAWERALRLREEKLGDGTPQRASTLLGLGEALLGLGEQAAAVELLESGVESTVIHYGEDHPEHGVALCALGRARWRIGEYEEARADFERALEILEQRVGSPSAAVAAAASGLSLVLRYTGERPAAIVAGEKALAIRERLYGAQHPAVAESLNNLGGALAEIGDFAAARARFTRTLAIREAHFGAGHPLVGQTHANLARVFLSLDEYGAARAHYEQALGILRAAHGESHPQLAILLSGIAQLDAAQGRLAEARSGLEEVLRIRERALGPEHPLVALDLRQLSRAARAAGDFEAATSAAERSLRIREGRLGPHHPDVAFALEDLAAAELAAGRREAALAHAVRSAEVTSQYLADTFSALSERSALLHLRNLGAVEETLFAGLLSAGADAAAWLDACWTWTLRRRGRVLEEMAARHRLGSRGAPPAALAAWRELASARQGLADLLLGGDAEDATEYRRQVEAARLRKDSVEVTLSRVSRRFRERVRGLAVTLDDVRNAMPQGAALIEVVRVRLGEAQTAAGERDEHDVALVLDARRGRSFVDLGRAEESERLVASWRRALRDDRSLLGTGAAGSAEAQARAAGEALRRHLWDAVALRVGDAAMVFWVLEGHLHEVPIAALPLGASGYLVESLPAHHLLGAARDVVLLGEGDPADLGRGVLAMGAPDFEADAALRLAGVEPAAFADVFRGTESRCAPMAAAEWPPLPGSARELASIGSLFQGREPLLLLRGADASEERLKLEARGKRILHLATHGFFLPRACRDEVLESPLLHSGLVLAGANRRRGDDGKGDDGLVTAEELATLDLSGVELVVLSGCDTGRGDVEAGEGVFGLRRALRIAGARTVVMSLWPVPDSSARRWTTTFYGALHADRSVLEATRQASLELLHHLRETGTATHPYLWAGFVAAGDWR